MAEPDDDVVVVDELSHDDIEQDQGDALDEVLDPELVDFDEPDPVAELDNKLSLTRRTGSVRASHDVAVRRGQLLRRRELALLSDDEAELDADLKRRRADRAARIELETLRRTTAAGGHRARIRTLVMRSAEHRAVRVETVRRVGLRVGGAALGVMALWSTAGVHSGVVGLLHQGAGSVGWWAAWAVEPALMSIVALIIVSRSMLKSAGGTLDDAAGWVEAGALATSILLNLAGVDIGHWSIATVPLLAAHSIGPAGAAAVAYLIGVIDGACAKADPWTGVPTMADLGLIEAVEGSPAPQSSSANTLRVVSDQGGQVRTPIKQQKQAPGTTSELTPADRQVLAATLAAITRGELTTPVTATAIYRDVMGRRGDRGRATRVAALVAA